MIAEVSRESVLAAIDECDRSGRIAFLSWHGFRRSSIYVLVYRRRTYDSKAILGAAHGHQHGEPLGPHDFSGGVEHAARRLVHLGFVVRRGSERLTLDDVALPARMTRRPVAGDLRLYVCHPTNRRSVAACYEHGFGTLVSPLTTIGGKLDDRSGRVQPLPGLPYVIDNGAWACNEAGIDWQHGPLERLVERLAGLPDRPGWLVLPDIVAGGERSLERSLTWLDGHRGWLRDCGIPSVALAVQNGMTPERVGPLLTEHGIDVIFVGGDRRWKWSTVHEWAELGLDLGVRVHVGRVNGERRAKICRDIGCASIDGSSVTRYAKNAEKMARAHDGTEVPPDDARLAVRIRKFELTLGDKA